MRRHEVHRHVVEKLKLAIDFGLDAPLVLAIHAIPLVHSDRQCSARVEHRAQQAGVLVGDSVAGVDDEDHHVGRGNRLQGFDDAEFFDGLRDTAAAAYSGGVDERVITPGVSKRHANAVAGGTGDVVSDQPVLAEQTIDERRLADIGSTDDGDPDTGVFDASGAENTMFPE